jgi:hypothetical protein
VVEERNIGFATLSRNGGTNVINSDNLQTTTTKKRKEEGRKDVGCLNR